MNFTPEITITVHTLNDLEALIKTFKLHCRPAGRGRPIRLGARNFVLESNNKTVNLSLRVGESCLGGGSWGLTSKLYNVDTGERITLSRVAKLIAS